MKMSWMRNSVRAFGLLVLVAGIGNVALAGGPVVGAPEIDPGSMASALALLSGGVLILTGRRPRK